MHIDKRSYLSQWLLFAVIMLIIGSYVSWDLYRDHRRIDSDERDRLQSQVNIIDLNLERQLLTVDRSLHSLRGILPLLQAQPDAKLLIKQRLEAMAQSSPGVRTVVLINAEGRCVASNRDELVGQNFRGSERYQILSRETDMNNLHVSAPFLSPLNNFAVGAGKVIRDDHGKFGGYLLAVIDPLFFETLLRSVLYAPDMRAAVIHSGGKVVARLPDPQKIVGTDLSTSNGFFLQHIQSGNRTTVQSGKSLATGETRLTVMQTMRGSQAFMDKPLIVALSREPVAIFATWRKEMTAQISLYGLLLMSCLLGLLLYHRRQRAFDLLRARSEEDRRRADYQIRLSEENLRITLNSIGDAVMVTDAAGRITQMNPAAERLTGWPIQDAAGHALQEVLHIVNADTRAVVSNPAELVMQRGEIVGLANHTVLIARDGKEYQIADSAAPIRSGDGTITGVVVVFSDVTEQYRVQKALRDREALLRTFSDHARIGMVMVTEDRRFIFANTAYAELLGLASDDLVGKHVPDVLSDVYEAQIRPRLDHAFAGEHVEYELLIPPRPPERQERCLAITYDPPVVTSDGPCVIVLVTDITARKQAEKAQAQLAAIVECTDDAIVGRAPDDTITSWNAAAERLFGWTTDEAIGKSFRKLLSLTPDKALRGRFEKVLQGESVDTLEDVRLRKDRSRIFVDTTMSAVKDPAGTIAGVSCIMRDITERKRAEAARARLAAIIESSHEAIFSRTLDGIFLSWNGGAERMFGYSASEIVGKSALVTLPPGQPSNLAANNAAVLRDGVLVRESTRMAKDGRSLVVRGSYSPLRNDSGAVIGVSVIMQDITALKQAESVRLALEAQLREAQKMQAIGTLAGGIAHDFNNIIATIIGNTELARDDAKGNAPVMESLDEIQKATVRARDLVQQILSFSRRQPTELKDIALEPVVFECARLLRATLPKRISLEVQCAPSVPTVMADATLIQQTLLNLCTNAVHAIPNGPGRVQLTLDTVTLDEDLARSLASLQDLHSRFPGLTVRITVRDTGTGMDKETLGRIFEPFFTTKSVNEGTGLGLSVVLGIVEAHQGVILVDSEPGKGTIFSIYLPASSATAPTQVTARDADSRTVTPAAHSGRRVLYIDDDSLLLSLMARTLSRRGFHVSAFSNQREAIETLRADPAAFDLVLTDYNMPELSGLDVAREVRKIRQDLPVVVTSGFIDDTLLAQAEDAGVRELISKVDSAEELCATLQRLTNDWQRE